MLLRLASIVAALASSAVAEVKDLTPDNFDEIVTGETSVFVKFYAPWCGHCKSMAEDYINLSDAFSKYNDVVIAEVDADKHKSLGSRFGVTGFPTLKWFQKGSTEAETYDKARGLQEMLDFVNTKAGTKAFVRQAPSHVTVLTPANFETVIGGNEGKLVEFYAPWCGHCKKLAPIYEKLATTYVNEKNVVIANCDADAHRSLGAPYEVKGFPTLKWFPPECHGPECVEEYNGAREGENMVDFINEKMGTKRIFGGMLNEHAGTDANLDALVSEFMAADDKDQVVADAEAVANDSNIFYVKVMKKMTKLGSEGKEWLSNEVVRLAGMLDKPVASTKKDDFVKRLNIVKKFHDEL